ncbi:MAG: CpaF family protein [Hungatella sp.]|nr:CpaF family protein [Hungatella sp.]
MTRKRGEQPLKEQTDRKKGVREELRQQIREEVSGRLSLSDEELYDMIDRLIMEREAREYLPLKERIELRTALFNSFRRLDILQQLIDDPDVTEVMINGPEHIFIEKKGVMKLWEQEFESQEQLEDMIQQMVSRVNRTVNVASPIADARLPDGSRVHVVLPPVSLDGPAVTIRKFPRRITMDMLIASGTVSREAADFLKKLVRSGYNIFISGGTNSGKTTFLNALSAFIPQDERVITIEDSAELQIQQVKNLIRLETRTANPQGEGAITIGDLIRASLRMNPSRIIVGEVRGKEALELLNSYNTGHDGGMSSGHGNSPKDMLARLETMVLMGADLPLAAIRSQIASALDILIHLGRIQDKSRKVLWIVEVDDYAEGEIRLRTLYRFEDGGLKKKEQLKNREKLQRSGEST